jgi:hypothetical protein
LTETLDRFALDPLEQAKSAESLANEIAAFDKTGRWIAIRNRLEDKDDETGALLEDFKVKVNPAGGKASGTWFQSARCCSPRKHGPLGKTDPSDPDDNGGPALEAIKAKLPGFKAS